MARQIESHPNHSSAPIVAPNRYAIYGTESVLPTRELQLAIKTHAFCTHHIHLKVQQWIESSQTLFFSSFLFFLFLQLSELEQRVVEAETRAEDAEDKVRPNTFPIRSILNRLRLFGIHGQKVHCCYKSGDRKSTFNLLEENKLALLLSSSVHN